MIFANVLSYILVLIGALNWGLYGIFNFNLVGWIFQGPRTAGSVIVYVLVTLAAIWLIISSIVSGGLLRFGNESRGKKEESQN